VRTEKKVGPNLSLRGMFIIGVKEKGNPKRIVRNYLSPFSVAVTEYLRLGNL
jgi:hypothetical protein